jgi:hypothetical protein
VRRIVLGAGMCTDGNGPLVLWLLFVALVVTLMLFSAFVTGRITFKGARPLERSTEPRVFRSWCIAALAIDVMIILSASIVCWPSLI